MESRKRLVVKLGTSSLTHESGKLNLRKIDRLVRVLADLKNAGNEIVMVSSGAVGVGASKLGMKQRPREVVERQAAASVGQCELMYLYDKIFSEYGYVVSQVLLTKDIVDIPARKKNVTNTFFKLLEYDAIPIVNENDTVATDEIECIDHFGDNDTLSAVVASLIQADLLVIMSDIDGLYDKNPRTSEDAQLIKEVTELTPDILALAGDAGSSFGTGGMITKLHAAKICMEDGIDMRIVNSEEPECLYDICEGKEVGTLFVGRKEA